MVSMEAVEDHVDIMSSLQAPKKARPFSASSRLHLRSLQERLRSNSVSCSNFTDRKPGVTMIYDIQHPVLGRVEAYGHLAVLQTARVMYICWVPQQNLTAKIHGGLRYQCNNCRNCKHVCRPDERSLLTSVVWFCIFLVSRPQPVAA